MKVEQIASLIRSARKANTPTAAQLGRDWRVPTGEVAALELTTITTVTITQEGERTLQARRKRKAGTARCGSPEIGRAEALAGRQRFVEGGLL